MVSLATDYGLRGWNVFPCHWMLGGKCSCGRECSSPGKHPLTAHGLKDATTELDLIVDWWRKWPRANIGLATGKLYVVDLDGDGGVAAWEALEITHSPAPTLLARTGGGGIHRYYQMPPDVNLPNTAGRLARHVDTRGVGGYVLAPPSNHKSGHAYEWVNQAAPAPLPSWVVEALRPKLPPQPAAPARPTHGSRYGEGVMSNALTRIAQAPEGERNERLNYEAFVIGQYVAGGEIDPTGVFEVLLSAAPDPDHGKSAQTIRRALNEGAQYPRSKQDD